MGWEHTLPDSPSWRALARPVRAWGSVSGPIPTPPHLPGVGFLAMGASQGPRTPQLQALRVPCHPELRPQGGREHEQEQRPGSVSSHKAAASRALAGAPGGSSAGPSQQWWPPGCVQGGVSDPGKDPSAVSGWDESPGGADRALCAGQGSGRPHRSPLKGSPAVPPHPGGSLGPPLSPPHRGAARLPWGHPGGSAGQALHSPASSHTALFLPSLPAPGPAWMWPLPSCCSWRCLLGPGVAGAASPAVCAGVLLVQPGPRGPGAHVRRPRGHVGGAAPPAATIDISILKGECTRRSGLLCPWPYRDTYAEEGTGAPRGQWMGACSLLSMATPGGQRVSWGRAVDRGPEAALSPAPRGGEGSWVPLGVREAGLWEGLTLGPGLPAALSLNPSALLQRPVQTLPLAAA